MNKEESFPKLCEVAGGGARRGDRVESASDSDVGRATSLSDKTHFPQKRRSLIFWLQTRGAAGRRWWGGGGGEVLNNMNIMKRS